MKKNWEKLYDEEVPASFEDRLFRASRAQMAASESSRRWDFVLVPTFGLATAAAVFAFALLLPKAQVSRPVQVAVLNDAPEMLLESDFFADLTVIENLDKLEKAWKRKWPKKKS